VWNMGLTTRSFHPAAPFLYAAGALRREIGHIADGYTLRSSSTCTPGMWWAGKHRARYARIRHLTHSRWGSRGDSYDNALAESLNGLYKREVIRKDGPWLGLDDVEFATLEWVDWFNHRRPHGEIGMFPAAEFGANYYRRLKGGCCSAWQRGR
jgi:transposase InsO family protein